jgi:hypothetical protein
MGEQRMLHGCVNSAVFPAQLREISKLKEILASALELSYPIPI